MSEYLRDKSVPWVKLHPCITILE